MKKSNEKRVKKFTAAVRVHKVVRGACWLSGKDGDTKYRFTMEVHGGRRPGRFGWYPVYFSVTPDYYDDSWDFNSRSDAHNAAQSVLRYIRKNASGKGVTKREAIAHYAAYCRARKRKSTQEAR
jgi:hypothetical protein